MPTFIFAMKQYFHLHLLWSRTIICLCNEAALALFFCHKAASTSYLHWGHIYTSFIPKPCQHPSFPWSHDNTSFVLKSCQHSWSHVKTLFAPKPCQHPSLPWSHDNTSFILKSCQHSWSHVKTLFAPTPCQHSWSHEVTSTLHISTGVMPILVFAMKLRQHFIRTKAVPTFIFAMKLCQHLLKSCQHSWSHVKTPFAPKPCRHSSLPWSHDNIPH